MNTYQYDLLTRLDFTRYGGTDAELKAANIILEEIEKAGGKGEIMDFKIPAYNLKKCSLKVTAPFEMELETVPYGLSGCLPEGGVDLKLVYLQKGTENDFYGVGDLSDSIVMLNELSFDAYKRMCEKNAAAFIVIDGKWYHNSENSDFFQRNLGEKMLENGKIPGYLIWSKDATELVRNHAETIHAEMVQEEYEATSRDVVAVVEGTEKNGESVVVTAHFDSIQWGTGVWDNATGSVNIMYIYKHFLANPPKRTMYFVWCGSEEQGLYGSKAFIAQHPELVEKEIKFCFNFDMCGTVLGNNMIFATGGENLKTFTEQFCHEYGMSAEIILDVHSSDSAPFADKGVPGLGLSRGTKSADIHTRHDSIFPISAEQLNKDGDFAIAIMSRVINSARLPVATGMPEEMKTKVDKYFQKDKVPYKKEEAKKEETAE
ncbi:MAG: M28 family peptidase [Oscillospiraceae bacterium]|nr:M28 family peptidase [Oscillospiraceae bacterium]